MRSETTSESSAKLSPIIGRQLAALVEQQEELRAQMALRDCLYWLTECTRTRDEQEMAGDPLKPFPLWPYFKPALQYLENEPVAPVKKSRTLMMSWVVSGWAAHKAFNRPATKVVFQSQDEKRACHDVDYAKILWQNSIEPLRRRWKLAKPLDQQPYNRFLLANGSELVGIPGKPDQIRSEHPTIYVMEEANIIEQAEASYNTAVATQAPHIVLIGTAGAGWFAEFISAARWLDWPDYPG